MCGTGEDVFGQLVAVGVPYPNLTRCSTRSSSVRYNHMLAAKPAVHQSEALAALLYDFHTRSFDTEGAQAARDQQTSRVIPTIEVAAADDAKVQRLIPLHMQGEEMGRARNTGIVVAHRLLTLPGDLFSRTGRNLGDKMPEVLLDTLLIL